MSVGISGLAKRRTFVSFGLSPGIVRRTHQLGRRSRLISLCGGTHEARRALFFRYKLEDRDKTWEDAGARRQAFYNDLPPGRYRFRVIASNNDGV